MDIIKFEIEHHRNCLDIKIESDAGKVVFGNIVKVDLVNGNELHVYFDNLEHLAYAKNISEGTVLNYYPTIEPNGMVIPINSFKYEPKIVEKEVVKEIEKIVYRDKEVVKDTENVETAQSALQKQPKNDANFALDKNDVTDILVGNDSSAAPKPAKPKAKKMPKQKNPQPELLLS